MKSLVRLFRIIRFLVRLSMRLQRWRGLHIGRGLFRLFKWGVRNWLKKRIKARFVYVTGRDLRIYYRRGWRRFARTDVEE